MFIMNMKILNTFFVVTIEKQISIVNIPKTIDMRSIQNISKASKMSKDTSMKPCELFLF